MKHSIEVEARKQRMVALVLDQDGTEFYIALMEDYLASQRVGDVGVEQDLRHLKREYDLIWGAEDMWWFDKE